jgi:hypothetical protein
VAGSKEVQQLQQQVEALTETILDLKALLEDRTTGKRQP